jgi:hypothetical protein
VEAPASAVYGCLTMSTVATILSPHLDDAVLSCWHRLTEPGDVRVVNVFAGVPDDSVGVAWWDGLTAADSSAARMRERLDEDRAALALAGREAVCLELLDAQYRRTGQPTGVLDALGERLTPGSVVYVPAGLSSHPDHILVREAGLGLRERGFSLRLYADLPHALAYGWPAWVTGDTKDPLVDPDAWWGFCLSRAGLDPAELESEVHALDDEEFARKRAAMDEYATQLPALERLAPLDSLRHEVTWRA